MEQSYEWRFSVQDNELIQKEDLPLKKLENTYYRLSD